MIDLLRFDSSQEALDGASSKLASLLEDSEHPLLLLSGGSSVKVASKLFKDSNLGMNRWTIGQVDERYGAVGHDRSNWRALQESGFAPGHVLQTLPILSDGLSLEETAKIYEAQLKQAISDCDRSIALIGIGNDGHIAGMLPMDKQEFEDKFQNENLVAQFKGPDFERITITQSALNTLDYVVVYATGSSKVYAVQKLDDDVPINEHPAQLLKYVQDVSIFTSER